MKIYHMDLEQYTLKLDNTFKDNLGKVVFKVLAVTFFIMETIIKVLYWIIVHKDKENINQVSLNLKVVGKIRNLIKANIHLIME